jgi:hypothetical protein
MLTHPEHFKSRHIYRIKKKLQNNYETFWKINYLPMEIFSFSKGFRLYKLLIKCESLLLLTPTFLLLLNKPNVYIFY